MNIGSVFTVAMPGVCMTGFAIFVGLSQRHDLGVGYAAFIECGSTGG